MASIQTLRLVNTKSGATRPVAEDGRVTSQELAECDLVGFTDGGATSFSRRVKTNAWTRPAGSYAGETITPFKNSNGTGANAAGAITIVVADAVVTPTADKPAEAPASPAPTPPVKLPPAPPLLPRPLWGVAGIPTVAHGELYGFEVARCFPGGIVGSNAIDWVASGRKLIVAMAKQPWPVNVSAGEVKNWCHSLVKSLPKGTIIEISNEPNLKVYWKGTIQQHVDRVLIPAATTLKALGVTVLGTAASDGNLTTHQAMMAADSLVDGWAVHPYGDTIQEHENRLAAIRSLTAKPLWATEWNLNAQGGNPKVNWADKLQPLYNAASRYCACLCFYRIRKDPNILRFDDGAIYREDGQTPNEPFTSAIRALQRDPSKLQI